jgi:lysophospholipase L1-like esterase
MQLVLAALGLFVGLLGLTPMAAQAASKPRYYVSLGDSYSVGYQPGLGATPGYAAYTAAKTHMVLVNFGCAGATTTSILHTIGCPVVLPHTAGGQRYPSTTQLAAAQAFIAAHAGHIGLITVSIGGNDVTACASSDTPVLCVGGATATITSNVTQLAVALRAAAGPKVRILGLSYPDVILGAYVYPTNPGSAQSIQLAQLSVTGFKDLVNPALSAAYVGVGGRFVDVTSATGAYAPLTTTVNTASYGTVPVAVASVCALTWYCQRGDIHPKSAGYLLEGKLIVRSFNSK